MRIQLLGGLRVEHDGRPLTITGTMQLAVLFRLAIDAGAAVSYRAIAEDIWGMDAPENTRAALQSIVSRLRSQLPPGVIESTAGGYRMSVSRADVDALVFADLVQSAAAGGELSAETATEALLLWGGEPWVPSDNFDWFVRDLGRDRETAIRVGGAVPVAAESSPIPAPLTGLVGREGELATIADQLGSNRLVTIIGTGGAGKTRLAVETALRRRGSVLVELAPVGAGEVLGAILAVTGREIRLNDGVTELSGTRERVLEALLGRDALLVLDNCEHVIDTAAQVADDLLGALPRLRILATSREPLGVPGEAFVGVGALAHPTDPELDRLSPAELGGFAAVQLFRERALSARGADLADDELPTVARICARLDGLPLAIELAAAKLRTMTAGEVLSGLEDRFSLLTGGYRTALPRHQTLRAMIDWSWSLLTDEERHALAWFAVFPGGVGAADARELASGIGLSSAAVFDSLVDRSLLQRSRGRFRALETIREYGIDHLASTGELVAARRAQAEHLLHLMRRNDGLLRTERIIEAIEWFDAEEDNIAGALRFVTSVPLAETAVSLVVCCAWYWVIRSRNEDGATWLKAVGPLAANVEGDEARIISLIYPLMAGFADVDPDTADPDELMAKAGVLVRELGDLQVTGGSHDLLQLIVPGLQAFGEVVGKPNWMVNVRLPDARKLGLDPWPTATLDMARAAMSQNRGDIAELGAASALALSGFEQLGDRWGMSLAQQMRAEWLKLEGRLLEALELNERSTENMRLITSSWDLAQQQGLTIELLARLGRTVEARELVDALLEVAQADGNVRALVQLNLSALVLDVIMKDTASAGGRITTIDDAFASWPAVPHQLSAMVDSCKAAVDILRGDLGQAEDRLRIAAEAAIRSQDQPIVGFVAINVGSLALARGDIPAAVRAVNVATAVMGAYDATHPQIVEIDEAARAAGIGRPGPVEPDRPKAFETLRALLAP